MCFIYKILISSKVLYKRKIYALLNEINSLYKSSFTDINNFCWLTGGNVLQRFVDWLDQTVSANWGKIELYPQLLDIMWHSKIDVLYRHMRIFLWIEHEDSRCIWITLLTKTPCLRNFFFTKNVKVFSKLRKKINA